MDNHENLTGEWTGVYDYSDGSREAVPFKAAITDVMGQIYGAITEPNTFASREGSTLNASITGTKDKFSISFIKTYEIHSGHSIAYEGTLNADMSAIKGTWTTVERFPISGPFVMNRPRKIQQKNEEKILDEILLH